MIPQIVVQNEKVLRLQLFFIFFFYKWLQLYVIICDSTPNKYYDKKKIILLFIFFYSNITFSINQALWPARNFWRLPRNTSRFNPPKWDKKFAIVKKILLFPSVLLRKWCFTVCNLWLIASRNVVLFIMWMFPEKKKNIYIYIYI
jgi:hypothetical protein